LPLPLQVFTPSDREVVVTRSFDAPRELVWDCHTRPDLVRRWLTGPPGWSMPVCEIDLRVGGKYRYVLRGPNGEEMGLGGTYRELDRPKLLASVEIFDEDWTGGETYSSTRFENEGEGTKVTVAILYSSKEARDGALRTGMSDGMEGSFQSLDRLLENLS
jgi:uncharacterized protein YndB with AHSA1/START domain